MAKQPHILFQGEPLAPEFVGPAGESINSLDSGGRVAIFVGANSSGKSRMLRDLARRSSYVLGSDDEDAKLQRALADLGALASLPAGAPIVSWNVARHGIASVLPEGSQNGQVVIHPSTFAGAREFLIRGLKDNNAQQSSSSQELRLVDMFGELTRRGFPQNGNTSHERIDFIQPDSPVRTQIEATVRDLPDLRRLNESLLRVQPHRIYIPTLRSAHTLWQVNAGKNVRLHNDIMQDTFRHRYSEVAKTGNIEIFTGHDLHDRLLNAQCSPRPERQKKAEFEKFLSAHFFRNEPIELVAQIGSRENPYDGQINLVRPDSEQPFYRIGDGVSGIALLLYPLFLAPEGSWAFIEEPENHLHPAYQRIFLQALVADDSPLTKLGLKIFLTTHSNHLLEVAMESPDKVAVYSLSGVGDDRFSIRAVQGRDIRVLDALGVKNGSVYLANCSIWVEGPSDVIYLRAFLRALMAERPANARRYDEDLHYTFVEYGGSLLAHWGFDDESPKLLDAAAVANRICIIADLDSGKDEKHAAWRERAEKSNGALEYFTTTGREMENELSDAMLSHVVTKRLGSAEPLTELAGRPCRVDEYVGDYLVGVITKDASFCERVQKWRAESGTLKSAVKLGFANETARHLMAVDGDARPSVFGERARSLATKVFAFIEKHNQ